MVKAKASTCKIVSAAIIGHMLEFFDFTIYGVFAVAIGAQFFPNSSEYAQILSSVAVFAAGFFMRPFGGLFFGHIGDKYGRKVSLTASVLGMALFTLMMGFLPDYNSIGILAPICLVILRLLQGACVGGEASGASIFVLEHLHKLKPGLVGGIVNAALTMGILLAIITGMYLNTYFGSNAEIWRYAFMIGGLLGLVGLYIRLNVDETPIFNTLVQENRIESFPIKKVFTENTKNMILTIAVGGLTGGSNYLVMTYLNIFFSSVMMYDPNLAMSYAIFGNLIMVIFLPIMGMLSDRLGYTRTLVLFCLIVFVFSVPIFQLISSDDYPSILVGIALLGMVCAGIYAPLYPFMLKLFPAELRYSGIAFSLNVGVAIFGGTSTMICLALVKSTGLLYMPAMYWCFLCLMFLCTLVYVRKINVFTYLFAMKRKSTASEANG